MSRLGRLLFVVVALLALSGCTAIAVTSAVVGTVASVAVEVVEVPFEVAGAIMDDDDEEDAED